MALLIADVLFHFFQIRLTNAECGEAFLPLEELVFVLPYPGTGSHFDHLNGSSDGDCRWNRQQEMGVVSHSADDDRVKFVCSRDASHVAPETLAEALPYCVSPVFRGEDDVNEDTYMCVAHTGGAF